MSTADHNAARTSVTTSGSATTYARREHFLGTVHCVQLAEAPTGQKEQVERVSYRLNVLDGWVRHREWTDEAGLVWQGETTAPSRVGAVLDAAPECVEFIAASHMAWSAALKGAGRVRQAAAQRRALVKALRPYGLTLCAEGGSR